MRGSARPRQRAGKSAARLAALALAVAALTAGRWLAAQGAPPRPTIPVPAAAALQAAEAVALELVADQLRWPPPGEVYRPHRALQDVAARTEDPAVRYVLLHTAIGAAERHPAPRLALAAIRELAAAFTVDADTLAVDLLQRMHRAAADASGNAEVALAALEVANQRARADTDAAMLRFFDVAQRAAIASEDRALLTAVARELQRLRQRHAYYRDARRGVTGEQLAANELVVTGVLDGHDTIAEQPFSALAPFLREVPAALPTVRIADREPRQLAALARLARDDVSRRGLLQCAVARQAAAFTVGDDDKNAAASRVIAAWTAALADAPGLTALRFTDADDQRQLRFNNGDWRVEDRLLVGKSAGADNFATHRYAFTDIRSIVIRGGIRSKAGLNFRCKVGDVNLLLNWEVQPENHLYYRGQRTAKGPPALAVGKEHTILMFATPFGVQVFIDDVHWWTTPGRLQGTITVYPALGSEIFVREILVDGDLEAMVEGPRGTCM